MDTESGRKLGRNDDRSKLYLPKRSSVLVFCFLLLSLHFAQFSILDGIMSALLTDDTGREYMKDDQSLVEASVYLGILISSPLTGIFVVKSANPKTAIIFGSLICSFSSFFSPVLSNTVFGFMWARGIFGSGLGMLSIGLFHLLSFWVPKQEYTRSVIFIATSRYAGTMLSDLWSDVFTKIYSWEATFYWFSVIPLFFLPLWSYVVSRSPQTHPSITNSELNFLIANASPPEPHSLMIRKLVDSKPIWILFFVIILFNFAYNAILSVLPYFSVDVFWTDISFAVLTGLLLFGNIISMILDHILQSDKLDASNPRRLREAIGGCSLVAAGILLKLFCGVSHILFVRVAAFGLAMIFILTSFAGHYSALYDVAPRHAALIIGFAMVPSSILNIWGHVGLRWILDSTGNWSFVLSSISFPLVLGGILWGVFGSSERVIN